MAQSTDNVLCRSPVVGLNLPNKKEANNEKKSMSKIKANAMKGKAVPNNNLSQVVLATIETNIKDGKVRFITMSVNDALASSDRKSTRLNSSHVRISYA